MRVGGRGESAARGLGVCGGGAATRGCAAGGRAGGGGIGVWGCGEVHAMPRSAERRAGASGCPEGCGEGAEP